MLPPDVVREVEEVRARCAPLRARFHSSTEAARGLVLLALEERRDALVRDAISGPDGTLDWLARETLVYLHKCDWALLDTLALAVAVGLDGATVDVLGGPVLVYQSLRMIDDVVDGHTSYKGAYETLYGFLLRHYDEPEARAICILAATGLAIRGSALVTGSSAEHARRTVTGMLLECQSTETAPSLDEYLGIVERKMVSYSRLLYGPVLEAGGLPLEGPVATFFDSSFVLGQILNDLHDLEDDYARKQPNFWTAEGSGGAEDMLHRFSALVALFAELPEVLVPYAHARVADLTQYALEIVELGRPLG